MAHHEPPRPRPVRPYAGRAQPPPRPGRPQPSPSAPARAVPRSSGCGPGSCSSRWCSRSSAARLVQLQGVDPEHVRRRWPPPRGHGHRRAARRSAATSSTATASRSPTRSTAGWSWPTRRMTRRQGAASSPSSCPATSHVDYFRPCSALRQPRTAASPTSPAGCPRPSRLERRRPGSGRRLQGARHPRRPGALLPRPRRRRQPGRLHRHRRTRSPASSSAFNQQLAGKRRLGDLRGRRRQPDPARATAPWSRPSTAPTCTPPSTEDLQWYTQRVLRQTVLGARGDSGFAVVHGLPHRRDPRRWPTTRRTTPTTRQASPKKDRNSPGA